MRPYTAITAVKRVLLPGIERMTASSKISFPITAVRAQRCLALAEQTASVCCAESSLQITLLFILTLYYNMGYNIYHVTDFCDDFKNDLLIQLNFEYLFYILKIMKSKCDTIYSLKNLIWWRIRT